MSVKPGAWATYALTAVTSILVTGVLGWFTLAGGAVTADEVRVIVATQSPYIADRNAIQAAVAILQGVDGDLDAQIERLDVRLRNIEAALARIEARLD